MKITLQFGGRTHHVDDVPNDTTVTKARQYLPDHWQVPSGAVVYLVKEDRTLDTKPHMLLMDGDTLMFAHPHKLKGQ